MKRELRVPAKFSSLCLSFLGLPGADRRRDESRRSRLDAHLKPADPSFIRAVPGSTTGPSLDRSRGGRPLETPSSAALRCTSAFSRFGPYPRRAVTDTIASKEGMTCAGPSRSSPLGRCSAGSPAGRSSTGVAIRGSGPMFVNTVVNPRLLRRGLAGGGASEIGTIEHFGRRSGVRRLTPVHPEVDARRDPHPRAARPALRVGAQRPGGRALSPPAARPCLRARRTDDDPGERRRGPAVGRSARHGCPRVRVPQATNVRREPRRARAGRSEPAQVRPAGPW